MVVANATASVVVACVTPVDVQADATAVVIAASITTVDVATATAVVF